MPESRTIGELVGKVEGLTIAIDRLVKNQYDMRTEFMGMFKEFREELQGHTEEDELFYADVRSLKEWRDGTENVSGAERDLNDLKRGKTWLLGLMTGLSFAAGILGDKVSKVFGA